MAELTPGVACALSPMVRRVLAPNPGVMTGPGTNTYLIGIDEIAVVDPGPDDAEHLDTVAARAGVSIATVSIVLNGKGDRLAERTQRSVLAIAEQLGYHTNVAARSLRSGSVRTLAIVPSSEDIGGFTSSLLLHAAHAARAREYGLLLLPDSDWRGRVAQALNSGQVDGVILHSGLAPTDV
ncbi:MAG: LacI family DNA-binding transcriptional regulator, partial [Acidimicrobiia bacterium]|nr:LacI family DNA-binding transcriptional regulator [Acidimicrobiia bacterium]